MPNWGTVWGLLIFAIVVCFLTPVKAMEWPKEIAVSSVACIAEEDAVSILLTHKRTSLVAAQEQYAALQGKGVCLFGPYRGNFVSVAHEVLGLTVEGHALNGYVVELEANGFTFYIIVLRPADPQT